MFGSSFSARATQLDVDAHTKLTDGITSASAGDSAYLEFFHDATNLPKTFYKPGEFAFWGLNAPHGFSPTYTPQQYQLIKQANIKGVRYDVLWGGVQQYGPSWYNYNWGGMEDDINTYVNDGFSVSMLLGFTAYWSNGLRNRAFPPSQNVEGYVGSFTGQALTLPTRYQFTTEPDAMPLVVTPANAPTSKVYDEVVTTAFTEGMQPRTSRYPIVVGTQQVWVNENDGRGWVLWQQVGQLVNSPDGAEHYQIDRSGRIKFRANSLFYYHGKIPATGSSVKITYDVITGAYEKGVDYSVDHMTGRINRMPGGASLPVAVDDFSGPFLTGGWTWQNAPALYNVGVTKAGHLNYPISVSDTYSVGHYLYQTVSGQGDFAASLRVTTSASQGTTQTGILIYKDAQNWFRFALGAFAGRPLLTRCVNGQVSVYGVNGEIGFTVYSPRWVTVRKTGDTFTVFTSNNDLSGPDGGWQFAYSFDFPMTYPFRIGVSSVGIDAVGVSVDKFNMRIPAIPANGQVKVYYDYLDPAPFATFCRSMVTRFGDRVKYWEIWNEPDQSWTWRGGQDLYAVLLREASLAIKQVDPTAKVSSGGYANGSTNNLNVVYQTIGNSHFDVVAWHPYLFSNKPPDTVNWGSNSTNAVGRSAMVNNGDANKHVFFGELATASGVTATGGGMNDWKQAEYAMRMFGISRKLGYVQAIQWWPAIDMEAVGNDEMNKNGGHEGLFYKNSTVTKPVYWMYNNVANNRGVLMDLGSYDNDGKLIPASGSYPVKQVVVRVMDRSALSSIHIFGSLTNTDADCKPPAVAARFLGSATVYPFRVAVNTESDLLQHEDWTVTALTPLTLEVRGSKSGYQGIAVPGMEFTSQNGIATFTVPVAVYLPGERFEFQTFIGDSMRNIAVWRNDYNLSGPGVIIVTLPNITDVRYLSFRFIKHWNAASFKVDEIEVHDKANTNLARGKLYIADGYQPDGYAGAPTYPLAQAKLLQQNTPLDLPEKFLHFKGPGFAYVQEQNRASGIRVEGAIDAEEGDLVNVTGNLVRATGYQYVGSAMVTATGTRLSMEPLVVTNKGVTESMVDGLLVKTSGKIIPGSRTSNTMRIGDGSLGGQGLLVVADELIGYTESQFVELTGAAGRTTTGEHCLYIH